jgi:hypothetical protein
MKFQDMFKPGDIICADSFHNGKCMIVESLRYTDYENRFRYRCEDLVLNNQLWSAYESDEFWHIGYEWRIATDEDIVKYLTRFVKIPLGRIGEHHVVVLDDDGVQLNSERFDEFSIHLSADELIDLGIIINKYVVR